MIKFFGINTHTSKVLRPLLVRWEFPSPGWVKINDGVVRGYTDLASCGGIFCGSMGRLLVISLRFLTLRFLCYRFLWIHAIEEAQNMGSY